MSLSGYPQQSPQPNGTQSPPPKTGATWLFDHPKFTQKEREAGLVMERKIRSAKSFGSFGGSTLAYYIVGVRRVGKLNFFAQLGATFAGGFFAGQLMAPIAAAWQYQKLSSRVEDVEHMKRVMVEALQERSARAALPVGEQPVGGVNQRQQGGVTGNAPYPSLPSQSDTTMRMPGRRPNAGQTGSNQWGDDSFDDSVLYSSPGEASSRSTFSDQMPSAVNAASEAQQQQQQQQQQQGSRWAQIRGDRTGAQTSSWDRLREQNAKQTYEHSRGEGYAPPMADGRRQRPQETMVDPTFGKGINVQRAQSQRDYEASFERERRGIDG